MYLVIFDANVWIRFARSRDIAPLLDRMHQYGFVPVVNQYLLTEIFDALVKNRWMSAKQAISVVNYIQKIALFTAERAVYRISPDPKDNYLFDLAIQQNCVFIITDDHNLLSFGLAPVNMHTTNWFLKTFPV